ncbi:MAG TPA: hypothetical protein VFP37_08365 [Steroidobacteraceae bacterium]|nr:hypothetical protein [Steroidobacteraceae bacterium]
MTAFAAGKGLVIFSTGASRTNIGASTSLRLVDGSSRKWYDKVVMNIDYPFESHFAGEHGHVRTLQLPPGEYFLMPQTANPFFVTTAAPVYRFSVEAGRATYIGNFRLHEDRLTCTDDKAARDLEFFRAKNPAMSSVAVTPSIAQLAMTLDKFQTNGTIWGLP